MDEIKKILDRYPVDKYMELASDISDALDNDYDDIKIHRLASLVLHHQERIAVMHQIIKNLVEQIEWLQKNNGNAGIW